MHRRPSKWTGWINHAKGSGNTYKEWTANDGVHDEDVESGNTRRMMIAKENGVKESLMKESRRLMAILMKESRSQYQEHTEVKEEPESDDDTWGKWIGHSTFVEHSWWKWRGVLWPRANIVEDAGGTGLKMEMEPESDGETVATGNPHLMPKQEPCLDLSTLIEEAPTWPCRLSEDEKNLDWTDITIKQVMNATDRLYKPVTWQEKLEATEKWICLMCRKHYTAEDAHCTGCKKEEPVWEPPRRPPTPPSPPTRKLEDWILIWILNNW